MKLFSNTKLKGLQTFDEVRNFLNNITSINAGGCGISALAMYRWLKLHGKVTEQTAFYFLDNDEDNHNNNKKYLANKYILVKASSHVVLYHNDQTIDSGGFKSINNYDYALLEKSEKFLLAMINAVWSWNHSFERKKHVGKIAKTLGIDLSDIELYGDECNHID